MAAPYYTPMQGRGATYTDSQGNTYVFNGTSWDQTTTGGGFSAPARTPYNSPTTTTQEPTRMADASTYSLSDYFGGKDTDAYRRYKEGQKAGKWADLPDFLDQGGGRDGKIAKAYDPVEELMKSQQMIIDQETAYLDKYTKDNPFIFDEELAKQSATSEYEPYYTELLEDYLQDVELKKETVQDEEQLAQFLYGQNKGKLAREYQTAVESAKEGFAGKGLFYSGIKQRSLGRGEITYGEEQAEMRERRDFGARETGRTLEGLDIDAQRKERDLEREKQAQIESGILTRKGEAEKQYYTPLVQSYYRQFRSGSGDTLKGYTIPEYLRF